MAIQGFSLGGALQVGPFIQSKTFTPTHGGDLLLQRFKYIPDVSIRLSDALLYIHTATSKVDSTSREEWFDDILLMSSTFSSEFRGCSFFS